MSRFPTRNFRATTAIALALAFLTPTASRAQEVLDGMAAAVNGDVITFSQVRELVGPREKALHDQYQGAELAAKIKELRVKALNDLIDRQLIIQEFNKNKFQIPDYVVEDRVNVIVREEFGGDRKAFARTLEEQGYTLPRFRALEKEKIIVQAMRQHAVNNTIIIPPNKVEAYYNEHRKDFGTPAQVKLRMIVLKKEGETGAGKKQMAAEIREKVKNGAKFEEMAQMYSEDSSQASGGDWGWIDDKTLNSDLTTRAFALKPGNVSEVIDVGDSYYLLFCEAKRDAVIRPLGEVRGDITKKLEQLERQRSQERWLEGLRKKAYIKTF
jgi:peptidyl-prolyl cis-trans isomerase SurA